MIEADVLDRRIRLRYVVVLETGWINNVRDSDGTGNSIGPDSEIQAYSHDPQGQVVRCF